MALPELPADPALERALESAKPSLDAFARDPGTQMWARETLETEDGTAKLLEALRAKFTDLSFEDEIARARARGASGAQEASGPGVPAGREPGGDSAGPASRPASRDARASSSPSSSRGPSRSPSFASLSSSPSRHLGAIGGWAGRLIGKGGGRRGGAEGAEGAEGAGEAEEEEGGWVKEGAGGGAGAAGVAGSPASGDWWKVDGSGRVKGLVESTGEYVVVDHDDVVEALASFVASYLAGVPAASQLSPKDLRRALLVSVDDARRGRFRRALDWGAAAYKIVVIGYGAFSAYTSPWVAKALLGALWAALRTIGRTV